MATVTKEVEVISLQNACALLNCSRSFFYNHHKDNLQVAVKKGKTLMYRIEDIKALQNIIGVKGTTIFKEVKR